MREVVPGIFHWTAVHPQIGMEVSSYYVEPARALIDPLAPDEVMAELRERPAPERILLTNRHHLRDSERLSREFGCSIQCHEEGLHDFGSGPEVKGFVPGDEVAPGIRAFAVAAICPDEAALLIDHGGGALAVADGVINYGGLRFVPDTLIGENPDRVKHELAKAYERLLGEPFDALLIAHGEPIPTGGKDALREFVRQALA